MTTPKDTPQPQGELLLRTMPLPADTSFNGDVFGGWIMALAEMADIFPIFARRSRFQRGLSFTILCIAAGKTVGALIYYYNGWLP